MLSLDNCRIRKSKGKETTILLPATAGKKHIERLSRDLSKDFDIVISVPVENKVGYGDQDNAKGTEITLIRKNRTGSDKSQTEFDDIMRVLELVWPEDKVNRPVLRGTTADIDISELDCQAEPKQIGSAQES